MFARVGGGGGGGGGGRGWKGVERELENITSKVHTIKNCVTVNRCMILRVYSVRTKQLNVMV